MVINVSQKNWPGRILHGTLVRTVSGSSVSHIEVKQFAIIQVIYDVLQFICSFSVDSCKKRWKYLRERYVQQKKVGGSPNYEHLSRPYLEKMKFLDNFIQSRKSYRQVSQLFTSPSSALQSFDGNESSKSSSSMRLVGGHLNNDLDDTFPQYYMNQFPHANLVVKHEEGFGSDSHQKPNDMQMTNNNMPPSSSSSIASQESPATLISNSTTHELEDSTMTRKRRRTTSTSISERNNSHNLNHMERTHDTHQKQILNNLSENEEDHNTNDDASDHQSSSINNVSNDFLYPLYEQQQSLRAHKTAATEHANSTSSTFPNPVDLLNPFYQQAIARQFRSSDQLLGELVTSELMKMPKDRKKVVQRKILELLFFDDE